MASPRNSRRSLSAPEDGRRSVVSLALELCVTARVNRRRSEKRYPSACSRSSRFDCITMREQAKTSAPHPDPLLPAFALLEARLVVLRDVLVLGGRVGGIDHLVIPGNRLVEFLRAGQRAAEANHQQRIGAGIDSLLEVGNRFVVLLS